MLVVKEDVDTPIILGRPFLVTTDAIIDDKHSKLKFKIAWEEMEVNISNNVENSSSSEIYSMSATNDPVQGHGVAVHGYVTLEKGSIDIRSVKKNHVDEKSAQVFKR